MKTNPVSKIVKAAFIALIACALGSSLTFAQATRTWVSGVGDDANPCSRTAPCKTFAGAISKTAAGGEISVLDPGGFGGVTVTKSITLDGEGTLASILVAGTPGITINAAGGVVSLKNLLVFGVGNTGSPGTIGVRIIAAAEVNIENCTIYEFGQKGVSIETSADCRVNIKNTIIRNCAQGAVLAAPTAGGVVANISKCSLNNSTFGFKGQGTVKAILDDCVAASNAANGVIASAGASVSVNNCTINDNGGGVGGFGLQSSGAGAIVFISNNAIFNNATGIGVNAGGLMVSLKNNNITGNTVDLGPGAPTSSPGTQ